MKSLKDILNIVRIIENFLESNQTSSNNEESKQTEDISITLEVMDFLIETEMYKMDFMKLYEFFERSDLVRKVNGFIQSIEAKE